MNNSPTAAQVKEMAMKACVVSKDHVYYRINWCKHWSFEIINMRGEFIELQYDDIDLTRYKFYTLAEIVPT